jgi:hypothetical protein
MYARQGVTRHMRSGSSAHDGRGWSSAQHPYQGRGPRPEQDVPYGPEVSWPSGFRAVEFDSGEYRALVESSSGSGSEYSHVDPRAVDPRAGHPHGRRADNDYGDPGYGDPGYGDPGYADPGYEGPRGYQAPPRSKSQGSKGQGHNGQGFNGQAPQPVYPVTGAQEIYHEPTGRVEPRVERPSPRGEQPRVEQPRGEQPRAVDPRLVGLRYDELRYDDIDLEEGGFSRHDEPLDDEAWYAELRSSGPAQPQRPAGGGPAASGPAVSGGSAVGGAPGSRASGAGPAGSGPAGRMADRTGYNGPGGLGASSGPGSSGPRMSALPAGPGLAGPGSAGPGNARTSTSGLAKGMPRGPVPGNQLPKRPATPSFTPSRDRGYLGAPVAQVGVLTPPAGNRQVSQDTYIGNDTYVGQETVAWSMTDTDSGEIEVLEEYWEEEDVEYSALLADLDGDPAEARDTGSQPVVGRSGIGRRRGRSRDRRQWLGLCGVVAVAGAAIVLILNFASHSGGGPAHMLSMPDKIGSDYVRSNVIDQKDLAGLRQEFVQMTHGQATNVLSAAFEAGGVATGGTPQIVMTVDAHLADDNPSSSINGFIQEYKDAFVVQAGPLGGEAACVESVGSNADNAAICAWFDDDSFGVLVSPSMNASALAGQLQTFRSAVEHVKS